jgi:hypothetical protein
MDSPAGVGIGSTRRQREITAFAGEPLSLLEDHVSLALG